MSVSELLKVVFFGIVEGVTEWLPISSTGHMLLVDEFIQLDMSPEFKEMFFIVIQLGAIMAVVLLFWNKMFPFDITGKYRSFIRKDIFAIWFKAAFACIPGAIVTLLFDDYIEEHFHTPFVIALTLIIYGVAFIIIENRNKGLIPHIRSVSEIGFDTAFIIGVFQILSIIPGTSRSGATILGALIIGVSRVAATEFTFYLAVPVMIGMSGIKLIKYGFAFGSTELIVLLVGMLVAFTVSVIVIKYLLIYVKKHDFKAFGIYRILLGITVIAYFALKGNLKFFNF